MEFSFNFIDFLILVGILLFLIYLYGTWTFDYFKKINVSFIPALPLVGNMASVILRKEHRTFNITRSYTEFPKERYSGYFEGRNPQLILRDPELIGQIAIKDFSSFVDRRTFFDENSDPLFGNSLIALKGQKWRDMRSTLSPAFTGNKMKTIYILVSECAAQMVEYLKDESKKGPVIKEQKDLFSRYANDVVATAAFGIKVDSLGQPNNEFYEMGKNLYNFTGLSMKLKFLAFRTFPTITKALKIGFLNGEVSNFFGRLVIDTMNTREEKNIVRSDMINLLIQARKNTLSHDNESHDTENAGFATVQESSVGKEINKREWSDTELAAQGVLFFIAGFETVSRILCFITHELAVNPNIQQTLIEEIDEAREKYGVPTYENINKLNYLDMVISESLRKWPPGHVIDRVCVKPYTVKDIDGKPAFTIEKGNQVLFPVFGIHRDPQHYPDPEKFDPERFSEENKRNIKPFTFIPFGLGPRNCIGSRFALMELKAILFHILLDFTFEVCSKTSTPILISPKTPMFTPENGFWLELKPRIKQ